MDTPASIAARIKSAFAPNTQHLIEELDVPGMTAACASLRAKGFCEEELIGAAIEGFAEQVTAELRKRGLFLVECNEHEDEWLPHGMYVEFGGLYDTQSGTLKMGWVYEGVVFDDEGPFLRYLNSKAD